MLFYKKVRKDIFLKENVNIRGNQWWFLKGGSEENSVLRLRMKFLKLPL